jgi:hypothetical protein
MEAKTMKILLIKIHLIAEEFFQFSLITYLILLFTESLKKGFVSFFFNPNIILAIVLISGVIMVITDNQALHHPSHRKRISFSEKIYLSLLTLGSMVLVYATISVLGVLAIVVTLIIGILIGLLSLLFFME